MRVIKGFTVKHKNKYISERSFWSDDPLKAILFPDVEHCRKYLVSEYQHIYNVMRQEINNIKIIYIEIALAIKEKVVVSNDQRA